MTTTKTRPAEVDDFFSDANKPASNWFKFEKVGARIKGEILDIFEKPAKDGFPPQRCFLLKTEDGEQVNVGIKTTSDYLMGRTNGARVGDTIGFIYEKDIPPQTKGHHPAKSIIPFLRKGETKPVDEIAEMMDK